MADLTRSDFLRLVVGAGAGALGLGALAACGDDGGGPQQDANRPPIDAAAVDAPPIDAPPAGNCEMNGTTVQIGTNHGHVMPVSKEDIAAGAEKMYTMTGGGHTHPVTVTAAMFAMLAQNMTVMGVSTPDGTGHTHTFTIRCA